ncbi:hypothetical protein ACFC18_28265 [Streptomyces sp. NPDC056121]|uniref:hypothetical protein n=1 Tax=unclassified Streptomyces TaxID=2593676 RepID=UPI0035E214C1
MRVRTVAAGRDTSRSPARRRLSGAVGVTLAPTLAGGAVPALADSSRTFADASSADTSSTGADAAGDDVAITSGALSVSVAEDFRHAVRGPGRRRHVPDRVLGGRRSDPPPPRSFAADPDRYERFRHELLVRGIHVNVCGLACRFVPAALEEDDIRRTCEAVNEAFAVLWRTCAPPLAPRRPMAQDVPARAIML